MRSSLVWGVTELWLLDQRCIIFEKTANLIYNVAEAINRAMNVYNF